MGAREYGPKAIRRGREWANRWDLRKDGRKGGITTDDIIQRAFKKEMPDVLTRDRRANRKMGVS